jgi:hypothetical protein
MGTITRSLSNNITTGGVIAPAGITNATVANITSFPNASGGTLILLSTQTASNSATISFTSGLDSTYDAYEFHFINIAPKDADKLFQFQTSTNAGSSYGVTVQTNNFRAYHFENDTGSGVGYETGFDLAQSTSYIPLSQDTGNTADYNINGVLQIYNPSSTTYVKHFTVQVSQDYTNGTSGNIFVFNAGYFNTTTALNAVQFKMNTGNIDGIIKMYGVKKS